jgi:hypothetical protein
MIVGDAEIFELACLGVGQIAEFIEATRGLRLDDDLRDSRAKAKVALAAVASNLLRQASELQLSLEDQEKLEWLTTANFLEG